MSRHLTIGVTWVTLFLYAFFLPTLFAQNTSWTSHGPDGGSINCIGISQSNPMIIYAGTSAGVYKTADGGESWKRTSFTTSTKVTAILVHPQDSDMVILGTFRRGIYDSDNGGDSWNYRGLTEYTFNCLVQDPHDPGTIYTGTGEALFRGPDYISILRLFDNWGDSEHLKWWKNEVTGYAGWRMVNCILPDPDSAHILYAGGIRTSYDNGYGAFLVSRDSGKNWKDVKVDVPNGSEVSGLVTLKNSSGERTLVAICGGSLLSIGTILAKSSDEGSTWEEIEIPYEGKINPSILTVYPGKPGTVVIGSNNEDKPLWLYTEESGEWDFIAGTGLPYYLDGSDLQAIPGETPTWLLPSSIGGLYTSTGTEGRWTRMNKGIDNSFVNDFTVSIENPTRLFAATMESSKILSTSDAGQNWAEVPSRLSASFDVLVSAPSDPDILWAAQSTAGTGSYWVFKSEDGGMNWSDPINFLTGTPTNNRTEITDILIHPEDPETILIGTRPHLLNDIQSGFGIVARSTDGGDTWSNYSMSASCLAQDPKDPARIFVGKQLSGQVFLIEIDGSTTTLSNVEPEEGIADVLDIAFDRQGNYYIATKEGLWRAGVQGWDSLPCPESHITCLALDHSRLPSAIYAGSSSNGILYSEDMGESWVPFNNGLGNTRITDMEISGNMLYASASYGGIWAREIPESLNPPYLTHSTGNLKMSVFQNGAIGHAAPSWTYGDGLVYNDYTDPLYHGGLLIGSEETGLVMGQMGTFGINSDFRNTVPITGFSELGQWDQVSASGFDDASSLYPLGIEVEQRSYSRQAKDMVILSYSLKSAETSLNGVYAGIFSDWDVGGTEAYDENMGGFDMSRNMAYQFLESGQPDPNYYGIVALDGLSGTKIIEGGASRYIRKAAFSWITLVDETPPETGDLRTYIGTGPFDLQIGVPHEVFFAVVAGGSLSDLEENADLAIQEYESLKVTVGDTPPSSACSGLEVYPNPFREQTLISYSIMEGGETWLKVYDMRGMEVRSVPMGWQEAGQYKYSFHRQGLEAGFYSFQLISGNGISTRSMIIY